MRRRGTSGKYIKHAGLAAPLWIQQIVFSDAACVIRMVAAR